MPRSTVNDKLRVSNIQRENAVTALRDAAGDGRLSFEELTERVPAALTAITRGDLVRLIDDVVADEDLDRVIADPNVKGTGPGFRWEDPLVLRAGENPERTEGAWEIPPFIEILVGANGIRLDCQQAVPLNNLIDIAIVADGWGGSVTLVVPQGWGVDTQLIMVNGQNGAVSSKVATRPMAGYPRIVLRGRITGRVAARYPGYWDLRRLAKQQQRLALTR